MGYLGIPRTRLQHLWYLLTSGHSLAPDKLNRLQVIAGYLPQVLIGQCRLDPEEKLLRWRYILPLALLVCACAYLTTGPIRLGLLLILVSPAWIYAFAGTWDVVMDNRVYMTLPAVALILGGSWLACACVIVWSYASYMRARSWRTSKEFWTQAKRESPNNTRVLLNYANATMDRSVWIELMDRFPGTDDAGIACLNLAINDLEEYRQTGSKNARQGATTLYNCLKANWPHLATLPDAKRLKVAISRRSIPAGKRTRTV